MSKFTLEMDVRDIDTWHTLVPQVLISLAARVQNPNHVEFNGAAYDAEGIAVGKWNLDEESDEAFDKSAVNDQRLDFKFKVGDKVRVLIDKPLNAELKAGQIVIIRMLPSFLSGCYTVERLDEDGFYWSVQEHMIEAVS